MDYQVYIICVAVLFFVLYRFLSLVVCRRRCLLLYSDCCLLCVVRCGYRFRFSLIAMPIKGKKVIFFVWQDVLIPFFNQLLFF